MTLVLDKAETVLKRGDVVIQRGANHAWANRSGKPCRMLFVLVDGKVRAGNSRTRRAMSRSPVTGAANFPASRCGRRALSRARRRQASARRS